MRAPGKVTKAFLCVLVVVFTCLVQVVLGRQTGLLNKSEDVRPPLFDTPSYVELFDGDTLELELTGKESCHLGSLSVVLVNTDSKGRVIISFF